MLPPHKDCFSVRIRLLLLMMALAMVGSPTKNRIGGAGVAEDIICAGIFNDHRCLRSDDIFAVSLRLAFVGRCGVVKRWFTKGSKSCEPTNTKNKCKYDHLSNIYLHHGCVSQRALIRGEYQLHKMSRYRPLGPVATN